MNLAATLVYAYGTPEGLRKAWDTRGRGRNVASQENEKVKVFYHGTVLPSAKKILKEGISGEHSDKAFQVNDIPKSMKGYVYVTDSEHVAKMFAATRAAYDAAEPGDTFEIGGYELTKRPEAQPSYITPSKEVPAVIEVDIPEKVAATFEQDPDSMDAAFVKKGIIPKEYIKKVSVLQGGRPEYGVWKDFTPDNCCEAAAKKASRHFYMVYYGPMAALKMHLKAGQ